MPQCQFLFSAVFGFRKATQEIFSELTKETILRSFTPEDSRSPKESRRGATGWPHPHWARPTPWPRLGVVWAPWTASHSASPPIYSPRRKNPKSKPETSRKVPPSPSHRSQVSGDRSLCSGTLPGWGSAPGRISIDSTAIFIAVADSYDEE